jgi:hypothetical protein
VGHGLDIEEIHQQAVVAGLDHLLHRSGCRTDQQRAAVHRLQHAPAQQKGIGEIHMAGRYAKQVVQHGMGDGSNEVDA